MWLSFPSGSKDKTHSLLSGHRLVREGRAEDGNIPSGKAWEVPGGQ